MLRIAYNSSRAVVYNAAAYLTQRSLRVMSKRREFGSIQPDIKTLDYLDKIGLGRPNKRSTRQIVSAKRKQFGEKGKRLLQRNTQAIYEEAPPYPFNLVPKSVYFMQSVDNIVKAPKFSDVPEVAVIGRSNVGKSTLLNAILGFQSHQIEAVVSDKPGETKKLHFYGLSSSRSRSITREPAMIVTDMPGYGFAFMSEDQLESVNRLTKEYLLERPSLKRLLLLIDARHGFKVTDTQFFQNIMKTKNVPWKLQIVLTKCDLVDRPDLSRRLKVVKEHINDHLGGNALSNLPIIMVSGSKRQGITQLQRELASLVKSHATTAKAPNKLNKIQHTSDNADISQSKNIDSHKKIVDYHRVDSCFRNDPQPMKQESSQSASIRKTKKVESQEKNKISSISTNKLSEPITIEDVVPNNFQHDVSSLEYSMSRTTSLNTIADNVNNESVESQKRLIKVKSIRKEDLFRSVSAAGEIETATQKMDITLNTASQKHNQISSSQMIISNSNEKNASKIAVLLRNKKRNVIARPAKRMRIDEYLYQQAPRINDKVTSLSMDDRLADILEYHLKDLKSSVIKDSLSSEMNAKQIPLEIESSVEIEKKNKSNNFYARIHVNNQSVNSVASLDRMKVRFVKQRTTKEEECRQAKKNFYMNRFNKIIYKD